MEFYHELQKYPWDEVEAWIESRTASHVETAVGTQPMQLENFLSLLSPAAEPFLEEMAQCSHRLTEQRFGKVINLFAPLYLSNVCTNRCAYCGFNADNPVARLTLTPEQVETEAKFIHEMGFRHLLLVSGDSPHIVTMEYLHAVLEKLRPLFASISIEIFPLDGGAYCKLIEHGVDGLTVFQETYHEDRYRDFHLSGKKRDFRWRLGTPERGGDAGFRRLGMGALLGLCNWRVEGFFLADSGWERFWGSATGGSKVFSSDSMPATCYAPSGSHTSASLFPGCARRQELMSLHLRFPMPTWCNCSPLSGSSCLTPEWFSRRGNLPYFAIIWCRLE